MKRGNLNERKMYEAMERLVAFEPEDGYYLAYSGGKDSDAVLNLAILAGVKFEAVHNLTTVDAPETVRYIQANPLVRISKPRLDMFHLIIEKGFPPTRLQRYCCSELKEREGMGKVTLTGVRWSESENREKNSGLVKIIGKLKGTINMAEWYRAVYRVSEKGGVILNDDNAPSRRMVEHCYRTRKTMVNPIIDWTDSEVWGFLDYCKVSSNPLYECGYKRIGCVGCPLAGRRTRKNEFLRYPGYKKMYIKAFDRMIEEKHKRGEEYRLNWKTGEDVFNWWVSR